MRKNKTTETDRNVTDFINSYVDKDQKKEDSFKLIELFQECTGFEPKMWGPSIVGFGSYHYQYKSGHEGDAPILGFSPRKTAFSLYVYSDTPESRKLLDAFGKFKMGKACIYVNKLADIRMDVLRQLCDHTIAYLNEHHECACRK